MNAVLIEFSCAYQVDYCLLLKVKLPPLPDVICLLHINPHTTHNSSNRSYDEGLTLETSAFLPFTVANLRFQPSC